jgi:hypothetical protein
VLMVHGALDDIAPIHLSRRLLAAWEELSTARRPRAKPAIRDCLKARPRGAFGDRQRVPPPPRLFDALPERGRRFVEFASAGHNDLPYHDAAAYVAAVGGFLGELE